MEEYGVIMRFELPDCPEFCAYLKANAQGELRTDDPYHDQQTNSMKTKIYLGDAFLGEIYDLRQTQSSQTVGFHGSLLGIRMVKPSCWNMDMAEKRCVLISQKT